GRQQGKGRSRARCAGRRTRAPRGTARCERDERLGAQAVGTDRRGADLRESGHSGQPPAAPQLLTSPLANRSSAVAIAWMPRSPPALAPSTSASQTAISVPIPATWLHSLTVSPIPDGPQ